MSKIIVVAGPLAAAALLLAACASRSPASGQGGTAWGVGVFDSNGERLYFTATSDRGTTITYTGGPVSGMMMGAGYLACASCHGPDGRGGVHTMMGMQTMNAPDIRWSVLSGEMEGEHGGETETEGGHGDGDSGYDFDTFRLAVVEGKHPDSTSLSSNMPRWNIGDEDLADLVDYLKTLP
jgi:mono/diheme cytochrome c family protein